MMTQKKTVIVTALAIVLAVLVIIFIIGNEGAKIGTEPEASTAKSPSVQPEAREPLKITLFFLSENDDLLHPEDRKITAGTSLAEDVQTTINELIKGSEEGLLSPLPVETRIRQVFMAKDGTAYVDLTKDIVEKFSFGASSEMSAIYALVNTLAFNFSAIKKVSILIDGGEKETLGGHIDLSKPFVPQYSLIAK